MAVLTRVNGDVRGVTNVGHQLDANGARVGAGAVISTGIATPITVFKITAPDMSGEMGTLGAVETIIRTIATRATVIAYQVTTTQLAVIVERSNWTNDAELEDAIQALGATVGVGPIDLSAATVDSSGGLELA